MHSEKKVPSVHSLIDLLRIPPDQRKTTEIESICRLTSNLKFFQDLTEKEESSKLHQECCKVLTVQSFNENDYVCHKGEEGRAFFFILKGSVSILSNEPFEAQEEERVQTSDPSPEKSPEDASEACMSEKEIAVLSVGQTFGEMALINDRPRYFSVRCAEPTVLGLLHKQDYQIIAKVHQLQINEKVEFIRNMEAFKTWTRIAVQKVSFFFKSARFKKGNIVYSEGDPPKDVFIVKDGEFVFTQKFLIDAGEKKPEENFGKLKRRTAERVFRLKRLNVVIKSKGEIFGYSEIHENLPGRQFTCTCSSTKGELLVISDKNFAKKIVHPETLKFIEDGHQKMKPWLQYHVDRLKMTERLKDSMSFTPSSRIRFHRRDKETSENRFPSVFVPAKERSLNPIERFIMHSQKKSPASHKFEDTEVMMFPTEVSENNLVRRKRIRLKSFNITKTITDLVLN